MTNISTGSKPLIDERRLIDGVWHAWCSDGWIAETYAANVFWPIEEKLGFLATPFPERFHKINGGDFSKTGPLFAVGLKIITDDGAGHKIIPTAQVVFAFGKSNGSNRHAEVIEREFDLPPSMVRGLAARLLEFCDSAEAIDNSGDGIALKIIAHPSGNQKSRPSVRIREYAKKSWPTGQWGDLFRALYRGRPNG